MNNIFISTRTKLSSLILISISLPALAQSNDAELQDMSDPLAVYSTFGTGITDKGINLKFGQSYDTKDPTTLGMHLLEVKGIGGSALGLRDNDDAMFNGVDDAIDSLRYRHFSVNLKNMVGQQLDANYDVETDTLSTSYSFIKALPSAGPLTLYPLAGVGFNLTNEVEPVENEKDVKLGYYIPGTYTVVGMYSKLDLTDKIWVNYNPMYMRALSGSDAFVNESFGGDGDLLQHEFSLSYKLSPRSNVRYFANWNDKVDFSKGDHRIEYNYQF